MPNLKDDQEKGDLEKKSDQPDDGHVKKEDFEDYINKLKTELTTTFEEKVKNLQEIGGGWSNEVGEIRKTAESINQRLDSFEEKFKNDDNDEIDLLDSKQLAEFVTGNSSKAAQDAVKPLLEKFDKLSESVVTRDGLTEMLGNAQKVASLKQEFHLNDEEVNELSAEAEEKGISARELAFEKYAERKFKDKKFSQKLIDELKNKDNEPPPPTADEAVYEKLGLPQDMEGFEKLHKEKGSAKTKELLIEADKARRDSG